MEIRTNKIINANHQPYVIIDTQGGIEEIVALIVSIKLCKEYNKHLIGISCIGSKKQLNDVVSDALLACKLSAVKIPIFPGVKQSIMLNKQYPQYYGNRNDNNFLRSMKEQFLQQTDYAMVQDIKASKFLSDSAYKYGKELACICLGPSSNLALAFHLSSSVGRIGLVSLNGGQYTGISNIKGNCYAESNFNYDPEAAHIIISNFKNNTYLNPIEKTLEKSWKVIFTQILNSKKLNTKMQKILLKLNDTKEQTFCGSLINILSVLNNNVLKQYFQVYAQVTLIGEDIRGFLSIDWLRLDVKEGDSIPNIKIYAQFDEQIMNNDLYACFIE